MKAAYVCLGALLGALASTGESNAADQLLPGRITVVKAGKLAKFVSKGGPFVLPAPGSDGDPTQHGAELHLFDTGGGAGSVAYPLLRTGWSGLGNPAGSRGYKYRGAAAGDTTCKVILVTPKVIKGVCKGAGVTLTPPFAGAEALVLGLPAGTTAGLAAGTAAAITRYCATYGGETVRNDYRGLKRKHAPAPSACAEPPPPPTPTGVPGTPTHTRTPTVTLTPSLTFTPTATPTITPIQPTPTAAPVVFHSCPLISGGSASHLEINAAAFPLSVNTTGELRIGLAAGADLTTASCEIDHIDPINIPAIGFVCIEPASGCDLGVADCNAGTPLGVDLRANGNIGPCPSQTTGNADCAASCASFCASGGRNYLSSGCTARCSDSERPCTEDDACAAVDEGACNGPESMSASQMDVCQCQCIDLRAGPAGGAGELQCQLGANINVENAAPCGDGDIKVAIGRTCIPLTSATATTQVNNANFGSNSVPSSPASNTGTRRTCAAINAGNTSGLKMRGVTNFFGSTLGDLAVELFSDCQ